jgi:hypothetical protein
MLPIFFLLVSLMKLNSARIPLFRISEILGSVRVCWCCWNSELANVSCLVWNHQPWIYLTYRSRVELESSKNYRIGFLAPLLLRQPVKIWGLRLLLM